MEVDNIIDRAKWTILDRLNSFDPIRAKQELDKVLVFLNWRMEELEEKIELENKIESRGYIQAGNEAVLEATGCGRI